MLHDIIKLREDGLSFRRIAAELNTTVGKVQYRWNKWMENQECKGQQRVNSPETAAELSPERELLPAFIPVKGELSVRLVSSQKIILFWEVSALADTVIESYFDICLSELVSVMRIYDVTDIIFDGKNAHHFYEITVPYKHGHWFVKGLTANRSYIAELGVLLPTTGYFPLLRSNCIQTPKLEWSSNLLSHDQLEILRYEAKPPRWNDYVSTYSYYGEEDSGKE